ncbi:hypothetical protein RRG08_021572 [Elysia crispata]|uniref:Uncharacterized protein n=1 Tax=Elysia crispata TaxID=231223 RepID=A0AAE0XDZ6_9GAST|nr:hypothetical protein RRG08_021572 [Elysia crispata]
MAWLHDTEGMGRNGKTNKSISEFETSGGNNEEKKQVNGKAQRGAEKERIMMGRLGRQRGRGGQGEMELSASREGNSQKLIKAGQRLLTGESQARDEGK